MPSPPNFYGMLQHAVKQDTHQVILAVLQHPLTPADCARYLGSIGWTFANQADFPLLADQKASRLDLLAHHFDTLNLYLSSPQSELDGKSKPKKVKITPSVANYKPGGKTTLLLLGQINAFLEAHPVIDGHSSAPLKDLKKQCDMVELAAEQQLHLLDMTLQTYKLIVACLSHLDKALSPVNIDLASSLLTALNISFESAPKDSNVKPANPSVATPQNPLELPSTPTL
ncbi:hypothetical protein J132_08133 [Termitomyces sp. J132]|nr:hypothetical protein J132_08133 [Termitomyces sp. J132]